MVGESRLMAFYRGGRDDRGRRLEDVLGWDHHQLELVHDYIQWMFPLTERSMAQPSAPVLSADDVRMFRQDPALQQRMREALAVMLAFYGLEPPGPRRWLEFGNHNYLRLTRILRSLRLAGLEPEARRLFAALSEIHELHPSVVGATTFRYWQGAMA